MNDPATDVEARANRRARLFNLLYGMIAVGMGTLLAGSLARRLHDGQGLIAAKPWNLMPPGATNSLLGLAVAAMMIVMVPYVDKSISVKARAAILAGRPFERSLPGRSEQAELRAVYRARIVQTLLFYGIAVFANAINFLEQGRLPNLIAVVVLLVLMAVQFFNRDSLDAFVEEQSNLLRESRKSA